jgi:hypothetical protein
MESSTLPMVLPEDRLSYPSRRPQPGEVRKGQDPDKGSAFYQPILKRSSDGPLRPNCGSDSARFKKLNGDAIRILNKGDPATAAW